MFSPDACESAVPTPVGTFILPPGIYSCLARGEMLLTLGNSTLHYPRKEQNVIVWRTEKFINTLSKLSLKLHAFRAYYDF